MRVFNLNTGKTVECVVQTPGGAVTYEGEAHIDGVPVPAHQSSSTFLNAAGAKTVVCSNWPCR